MKLVEDWRCVLRRAWSIRLVLLAGLLSGLEVFLPIVEGYVDVPRGVFAALSGLATAGAFITRLIAQSSLSKDRSDEKQAD